MDKPLLKSTWQFAIYLTFITRIHISEQFDIRCLLLLKNIDLQQNKAFAQIKHLALIVTQMVARVPGIRASLWVLNIYVKRFKYICEVFWIYMRHREKEEKLNNYVVAMVIPISF